MTLTVNGSRAIAVAHTPTMLAARSARLARSAVRRYATAATGANAQIQHHSPSEVAPPPPPGVAVDPQR